MLLTLLGGLRRSRPDWRLGIVALAPGPLVDLARGLGCDARILPAPARLLALGEHGRAVGATLTQAARAVLPVRQYARTMAAALDEWRPDIVHANGLKAHVLAAMAASGRPVVWHLHEYVGRRRVSSALMRWYASRAACAVAVSHSVAADAHAALGPGIAVHTIHNGVDPARFSGDGGPADLDALAGLSPAPAGVARVGLVATYAHWKGHRAFLHAMAGLARSLPVRAYVIGGPVYETRQSQHSREAILRLVQEMGLEGVVGLVPFQSDVAGAYRALDVVVHASTEPEPFGLVVVEAMFCGRAVVASACGGTREIVDAARTGLLHVPGDSADLAAQIERLIRDPDLRARMGAAARRQAAERFDACTMTEAFENLYLRLAAGRAATANAPEVLSTR